MSGSCCCDVTVLLSLAGVNEAEFPVSGPRGSDSLGSRLWSTAQTDNVTSDCTSARPKNITNYKYMGVFLIFSPAANRNTRPHLHTSVNTHVTCVKVLENVSKGPCYMRMITLHQTSQIT